MLWSPPEYSRGKTTTTLISFDCQVGSLPFTYLGLTLGTTKPNIEEFLPLIKKVERRLGGISNMLFHGGKLELEFHKGSSLNWTNTGSIAFGEDLTCDLK